MPKRGTRKERQPQGDPDDPRGFERDFLEWMNSCARYENEKVGICCDQTYVIISRLICGSITCC